MITKYTLETLPIDKVKASVKRIKDGLENFFPAAVSNSKGCLLAQKAKNKG